MSTFTRNTRSNTNFGFLNKPIPNNLTNKTSSSNLNLHEKNVNKQPNPVKRSALSSTTNLLNKNVNLNGKIGGNLKDKKDVKVSKTECVPDEQKGQLKGLGGLNKANRLNNQQSKIPIKIGPKLKAPTKSTLAECQDDLSDVLRFSSFKIPENVENIDQYDTTNVLLAPDFSNDIYIYLRHLEDALKLKSNFLDTQQQMTSKMRARLIDWIIAVHHKFKLLPETLYLTISIMDRFLEKVNVTKEKVQLVGLTAFFIACKYEEIYPPEILDFLKVCDAYSKNEILKMEKTILKTLDFKLSYPLPLHFLRRFSKAANADQEIHTLAKYLMELGLLDYECSGWKPSLIAAVSLYLTLQLLSETTEPKWTETLAFYTDYKEDELQPYVAILSKILILTKDSKLQTVNKKYSSAKLLNISDSPKLMCDYVIEMSEKCI